MIKTTSHIYMDYQRMMTQANNLEAEAAKMERAVANRLSDYTHNNSYWKGDAGDQFRTKARKLEDNLKKEARELRKIAAAIRIAAERERNIELAIAASLHI